MQDGATLCEAVRLHFMRAHTATTCKLLRAKCNDLSLRAALRAGEIDPTRWGGLIDTFADYLSMDFVTPPPRMLVEFAQPSMDSGGIRETKYLDGDDKETLSVELARKGTLLDTHVTKADFDHLQLPLVIRDKDVKKCSAACVEAILRKHHKINWGMPFEAQIGRDMQAALGDVPQRKKRVKALKQAQAAALRKAAHRRDDGVSDESSDDEEVRADCRTWALVMHWKVINYRSAKATVRYFRDSNPDSNPS